mmetsp:Transcript_15446/g.27960  ORF Transcript_15446/g.27960 Transcript_15446/m.27960 type:complete len:704 (-) Transcript_15446:3656-5767(-)
MVQADIDGLTITLPFQPDDSQLQFMKAIKATLDARGVGMLEMPPASGKTTLLLAVVMAYKAAMSYPKQVIFCSQSIEASNEALDELKKIWNGSQELAITFSCKKNLCVNPMAKYAGSRLQVETKCLDLIAPWQERACMCPFYAKFRETSKALKLPQGIYTIADVKQFCEVAGLCPYFVQKNFLGAASFVMCTYQYVLNPKLSPGFLEAVPAESLIVFDDATMIDKNCIDMRSISLTQENLHQAFTCMKQLKDIFHDARSQSDDIDQEDLNSRDLPLSLRLQEKPRDDLLMNPIVPDDIMDDTVPGNLRRGEHFLIFVKRVLVFFRKQLKSREAKINSPAGFLYLMKTTAMIDQESLKHTSSRLHSLLSTLKITNLERFLPLITICDLCTLLVTNSAGYALILEPFPESSTDYDPVLQFTCLDASPAFQSVMQHFSSALLSSYLMTPFDYYSKLLNVSPVVTYSSEQIKTAKICPVILTRGSDQLAVSSNSEDHDDDAIMRNYGDLLVELADTVPDGIVCFFPSFKYIEDVVIKWNETGLLNRLLEYKLVFFQSHDPKETQLALHNFRLACDTGRGAILIIEGLSPMKFPGHYARCLVVFGVPFQNTLSRLIKARLNYLKEQKQLDERDFLNFDSMRQATRCASSALRQYKDFAVLVFADKRFAHPEKRDRFPKWITSALQMHHANLSTDMLVSVARTFLSMQV